MALALVGISFTARLLFDEDHAQIVALKLAAQSVFCPTRQLTSENAAHIEVARCRSVRLAGLYLRKHELLRFRIDFPGRTGLLLLLQKLRCISRAPIVEKVTFSETF